MRSKKALINIISSILLQMISIVSGLIIPRLIIGTYGSCINGLVASITRFLGFITLLEAGVGPVIKASLYKPIAKNDGSTIAKILKSSEKIFRVISYLFIVYILVLCVSLPFVVNSEFSTWFTVSLIVIISISIFAEYYFGMTYKLFLQAEQKAYVIYLIQICTLLFSTCIVVILIKIGTSIQVVKLVGSLIFVLRPILQNLYVKKKYNINFKEVDGNFNIKQKWDALAQHIAYVIHSNADVAILTIHGNMAEVSVYAVYMMIIDSVKNVVKSCVRGIEAAFGDMIAKEEKDNLNKSFKVYEGFYFTVVTIVFNATSFLIIPFVSIYTNGINDVNYIRPTFAVLMVIAELINLIRQPYNDLVKVSGHFKQTQIGAWFEAISNIVISFVLVWKFGIIGVAIGTIFAMFIRTIEFVCYTSKHILERSLWHSAKSIGAIVIEFIIITIIVHFMPKFEANSYGMWIINGVLITVISTFVVCLINCLIHKESFKYIIEYFKRIRGEK